MTSYVPVSLTGSNLGDRHRHLNTLVNTAYEDNVPIQDIIAFPERSSIDRVFKIDLASKYKNVDYIMENLKEDSMLYVSTALKCVWLLDSEYQSIINPAYLEENVYPEMIRPAVNKMKHWLQLNLKNSKRCEEFYNYYKSNFDDAFRYLWHCSNQFILSEFPNIADKLTPRQLKILFETCPAACNLYFEILPNNKTMLSRYLRDEGGYFETVKCLLKCNVNEYLDIVEKYFNKARSRQLNSSTTGYLLKKCKARVFAKIEFYASSVLHMNTLASTLTSEEAKNLILLLARAEYLSNWFSYKVVEPLIKRVQVEERAQLKKQVFVEKSVDGKITEWPYEIPITLKVEVEKENKLLWDVKRCSQQIEFLSLSMEGGFLKRKICKRKYKMDCSIVSRKSPLDKLFDQYRFVGFERTFNELRKSLLTENSKQGRLNIMLVLVSKSGGVQEQVEKLLTFLVEKHKNEPNTVRAAVIRSLVNRGCAWRLHDKSWNLLLEFGRDLGLDGAKTELLCQEGLHAVVIRHLLSNSSLSQNLLSGFLSNHSSLTEYKFNTSEKLIIGKRLPPLFLPSNPNAFLDALHEYKSTVAEFPEAKAVLVNLAQDDNDLLNRLYERKILRRELFSKIFELKQTEAAYINVLRHDISPLKNGEVFASLVQVKERLAYDTFLHSLRLYFSEPGGLAETHRVFLEKALEVKPKPLFARSLCILSSDDFILKRLDFDEFSIPKKGRDKVKFRISAAFRANLHKITPPLNIDEFNWQSLGAKAVANKVSTCRSIDRGRYLIKLSEWRRTAKVCLRLSLGTSFAVEYYLKVCTLRPLAALKFAVSSFFKQEEIDFRIWEAMRLIIKNLTERAGDPEYMSDKGRLIEKLENTNIPKRIEADYRGVIYKLCRKFDETMAITQLEHILDLLFDVDEKFIDDVTKEYIKEYPNIKLNIETIHIEIMSRSLVLSKSESRQEYLLDVCDKFFDAFDVLFETKKETNLLCEHVKKFIFALKFTKAFMEKQYVSPFPVFEKVLERLHKIMPTEQYFKFYVEIHLTMLYYKTIQQAMKLRADLSDSKKKNECIELIGRIFGKYIGFEVTQLVIKYFRSIIGLYREYLQTYIDDYFVYSEDRDLFITFVIKGLLDVKSKDAVLVAEYLFMKNRHRVPISDRDGIIKNFKEFDDAEVRFYLYDNILSYNILHY